MQLEQWEQGGHSFFHKGKFRIFYQESGKGETLVLLHGFPTASWDWHKVWAGLSDHFHTIALDFIGFGFSDKPESYLYNIADQADIVEYLLEERGIEKYHILAHDYGDTVAQELIARQYDRQQAHVEERSIQSVCFLNGGLFPESHEPRPIQKALMSPLGYFMKPILTKNALRRNFRKIFGPNTPPNSQEIDEFYHLMEYNEGKKVFYKLIWYMAERKKHRDRWVHPLQATDIPLCLINGPEDPISGRHLAERYAELVPQSKIVFLENIGHYPQIEAPEELLEQYLIFHQEVPKIEDSLN